MTGELGPENMLIYSEQIYAQDQDIAQLESIGSFEKGILFLVNKTDYTTENAELFLKIMSAAELSETDYKLVVLPTHLNPLSIISELKPSRLISFDTPAGSLTKILDTVVQINNIQLLSTNSLRKIGSESAAKKSFWNALKKIIK
jgi:hypothetical protein